MHKLYIGNETYLSLNHAHRMVKKLCDEKAPDYILIDGEKTDKSQIIDTLSSSSLFSTNRVIFLKRLYKNKDRSILIEFLLEHLNKDFTDDIVIWEDQKVSSITKYVKYFKSKNLLEEYNKINKPTFSKYVKTRFTESNLEACPSVTNLLVSYSNYDLQRFENTLEKIKLLKSNIITENIINEVVENTLEEDIWKLLDEINKEEGKPLRILEKILQQEKDPYYIFPMIVRNLRLITLTKYLLEKSLNYRDIASKLKIPPFTVKPLVGATNKYNWEEIRNKYEKLCNLDYEIKVGRIEPKLGLTLFCTTI
jgi:DNA polymerase III subunit delta